MVTDLSALSKGELITLVHKLLGEIDNLKETLVSLQGKLEQKDSVNGPSKPLPSFVKANVKKKKKKAKRKARAQGFSRKKEVATKKIFHTYEICPCGGELGRPSVAYSRQIIDIPQVRYEVIEHVVFKRHCFSCNKRVYPKVDLSGFTVGNGRIGINLMSAIFTMKEEGDMSLNKIKNHLKTFYDLDISIGEITEILHQVAALSKDAYEEIKQGLLASRVIYADETGGRESGVNGYHWSFSNEKFHMLLYRKSRSASVVREIFGENGENFQGVLSTDFYGAYNAYLGPHQRCWVHYLRDMKKLKEDNPKDRKLKTWIRAMHKLYQEAKSYIGPPEGTLVGLLEQARIGKEAYFKQKLKKLCEPYIKTQLLQATLAARGIRFLSEMFAFIRYEGVNSDNNMAERAVRKTVIKRKISFGTRSPKGSETRSVLGSLFGTWRLQNLNPFQEMRTLLLNPSCQGV
jgi:hypothetical protein